MKHLRTVAPSLLAILLAFGLSGCCDHNSNQEIANLQQRIDELEAQLEAAQTQPTDQDSTVNNPTATLPPNDVSNETGSSTPNNPTTSPDPAISSYIDEQLKSNSYEAWLSVAECADATPEQLLLTAQKCAGISNSNMPDYDYAIAIAYALTTNPSVNGRALAALCDSSYPDVIEITAESNYADSYALTRVAERCAAFGGYYDGEYIATLICQHPNANDKVIATLSETNSSNILLIAADSPYAGETVLTRLAERCAELDAYCYSEYIASAICRHPNATDEIVAILSKSESSEVLIAAANSPYAGETALTRLAERCAELSPYNSNAYNLAIAICANPNATAATLQPLANANNGDVIKIGHDAIDALTP